MQSLPMALMALTVSLYPSASRGCRYCREIKIMADVVASFHCTSKFEIGSLQNDFTVHTFLEKYV